MIDYIHMKHIDDLECIGVYHFINILMSFWQVNNFHLLMVELFDAGRCITMNKRHHCFNKNYQSQNDNGKDSVSGVLVVSIETGGHYHFGLDISPASIALTNVAT